MGYFCLKYWKMFLKLAKDVTIKRKVVDNIIDINTIKYNGMKTLRRLIVVMIAIVAISGTASAQLSFGVTAGAKINDLHFKRDAYDAPLNTGITGGLMMEYMFPNTNVGVDVSLMFLYIKTVLYENANYEHKNKLEKTSPFIELPVNFKWKIALPVARDIVKPYLSTGPCLSVTGGEQELGVQHMKNKAITIDWGVGLGVELFKKVQVGARYGFGLTNAYDTFGFKGKWTDIESRKNSWTISATYIF